MRIRIVVPRLASVVAPLLASAVALMLAGAAAPAAAQGKRSHGTGVRGTPGPGQSEESTAPLAGTAPALPPAGGKYGYTPSEIRDAIERGEGRQALEAYERAAADAEARGDLVTAVHAHAAAAFVAQRQALLQKVIQHGRRAIELGKQASSPELTPVVLAVYPRLAAGYRAVGDLARARALLDEGLAAARASNRPGAQASRAAILNALAKNAAAARDPDAALAYAREAAAALDSVVGGFGPRAHERARNRARHQAANAYLLVARLLIARHQGDEAAAALATASQYAKAVGDTDLDAEIVVMSGQLALDRQDYARAVALFEQGRAAAARRGATPRLIELDRGLMQAYERMGKLDEALAAAERTLGLIEGMRADLEDEALRASFLEQRQGNYQGAVRLALRLGKPEEAFALAERSRSRAFLDLLGNQAVLGKARTHALADEELRLRARLAEAAALAQDDEGESSDGARRRVEAAERDYRAFLGRVRLESGEAAALMSVEPVTLAEIQALLPDGTTLLEYLVGEHDVVLWIVDRSSVQVRRTPGSRSSLMADVRDLRAAIAEQAPVAEVERRAQALHQRLLGPARAAIRGQRLLIVPHDVLHYLPFAALRSPRGHWLIEDYALATVPSASVLKFLVDKGAAAPDRIVAIGNPDLGPALALRYAEREARAIAERFPGTTTVLTRGEATEARAKQLAGQAGVLHFAVHGELNEADPKASALLLAPGGGEDGRLEVRELFAMDLAARLVVLSACETGLGKLSRGDELVGLQRAFLYAGTPAVITTLWKVDDRASYLLMRAFYESLGPKGAAEALRSAQRALMTEIPHPFAWAAFGLTGMPR